MSRVGDKVYAKGESRLYCIHDSMNDVDDGITDIQYLQVQHYGGLGKSEETSTSGKWFCRRIDA